jgi:hypothetical protein
MTTPLTAFSVLAIVFAITMLFRVQRKKEQAYGIAVRFCQQHKIQLLDGTVAFRGWHITRPQFAIAYRFRFEYSSNRADRYHGTISLIGNHVQNIFVDQNHLPDNNPATDIEPNG